MNGVKFTEEGRRKRKSICHHHWVWIILLFDYIDTEHIKSCVAVSLRGPPPAQQNRSSNLDFTNTVPSLVDRNILDVVGHIQAKTDYCI